jgi:succinate dehydrogenase/fumarate reductase cytochrome b subunit
MSLPRGPTQGNCALALVALILMALGLLVLGIVLVVVIEGLVGLRYLLWRCSQGFQVVEC